MNEEQRAKSEERRVIENVKNSLCRGLAYRSPTATDRFLPLSPILDVQTRAALTRLRTTIGARCSEIEQILVCEYFPTLQQCCLAGIDLRRGVVPRNDRAFGYQARRRYGGSRQQVASTVPDLKVFKP